MSATKSFQSFESKTFKNSSRTRFIIRTSVRSKCVSKKIEPEPEPERSISSIHVNSLHEEKYGQTLDHTKNREVRKRRKYCTAYYFYCCVCVFLILAAIAALLIGILMKHETTSKISTESSTFSTTSITTTTTTAYICNTTCLNQTWQTSSNLTAQWLFDGTFSDQMNLYNLTVVNNVTFKTNGYVQQAAVFTSGLNQMLMAPYVPLSSTSFTIETWIYITQLLNIQDHSIIGLCSSASSYRCLHITIRRSSSNYYLFFSFYGSDCQGIMPVKLNTWIHVACVFDLTLMKKFIYFNGILDNSCASQTFQATVGNVTIGYIPSIEPTSSNNYFRGYIDQITITKRAKSACEVLNDASLTTYFTFNTGLELIDSGPNNLPARTQSTSTNQNGHFSQGQTFSNSPSSYFQISDVTTLGISNQSFSISFWIRPQSLTGVLVHVSSDSFGTGWCLPFIGFATNGSLVAQVKNNLSTISVFGPILSISTSTWFHVVQTWSSTNGLRLYLDNILVASNINQATAYSASELSNYVTLGNILNGTSCSQGAIGTLAPYNGDIDDFRIYNRELTSSDICTLYVA